MRANIGIMGAALALVAATGGIPGTSLPRREESPTLERRTWDYPFHAPVKNKPCGPKRKKAPSVRSSASHHHAGYLKREKSHQRRKKLKATRERDLFALQYANHIKRVFS